MALPVFPVNIRYRQLSIGDDVICGLPLDSSAVVCNGGDKYPTLSASLDLVYISNTDEVLCGLTSNGDVHCNGTISQLIDGFLTKFPVPSFFPGPWSLVEAGSEVICLVAAGTGLAKCIGDNADALSSPPQLPFTQVLGCSRFCFSLAHAVGVAGVVWFHSLLRFGQHTDSYMLGV